MINEEHTVFTVYLWDTPEPYLIYSRKLLILNVLNLLKMFIFGWNLYMNMQCEKNVSIYKILTDKDKLIQ